jgi:hypothetical protein
MPDLAELFPSIDLGSAPRNGGCATPIGRRRVYRPRRFRAPSPMMTMLAQLRKQIGDGFVTIGFALKRIEGDTARNADSAAELAEAVDQLRVRITALERHGGSRPPPEVPRHSRRRPLE